MTDYNMNLNDLLILYACGKLEPNIASQFEKELQKQPDLEAQAEQLRLLDCAMTIALTPPDDASDLYNCEEHASSKLTTKPSKMKFKKICRADNIQHGLCYFEQRSSGQEEERKYI